MFVQGVILKTAMEFTCILEAATECKCMKFNAIAGTIPKDPPIKLNSKLILEDPFDLKQWIAENRTQLDEEGSIPVFGEHYQFQVSSFYAGRKIWGGNMEWGGYRFEFWFRWWHFSL